ncbi:hypothetical protein EC957_005850 [Mortierella hygrophila]|uniref:Uncharacterized protein n=1 Tax=Mortierella hygrophila TaxID=979708 RepID=A0A9P6JZI9_9FUNG|nr:hypothetical protein EC957_005850 [Mortierella hygrophila]
MDDVAILNAALKANLTALQSLTFSNLDLSWLCMNGKEYDLDRELLSPIPNEWETLVPRSTFWSHARNTRVLNQTMAVSAFVLSNPGLQRLAFNSVLPLDNFAIAITTTSYPLRFVYNLTPASESFLTSTFSTLTKIRHLDIGMHADDYLFSNMGTLLPTLWSFVHSGRTEFDYRTLALSIPHSNLRSLAFTKGSISHQQLRSIVLAFLALRDLSPYGYNVKWTPDTPHLPTFEHHSFHTLSTLIAKDLPAIETARVRFPNIRTACIKAGNVEKPTAIFQQLSTIFPAMECLEARRVYW